MSQKVSDESFIATWKSLGSPLEVSKALGITERSIYKRRQSLADKGIDLMTVPLHKYNKGSNGRSSVNWQVQGHAYTPRINRTIKDAQVIVGSDAHYWPDHIPFAHRAFCVVAKAIKAEIVCLNGDVLDGATISRHEPLGWQKLPRAVDELGASKARTGEIERASPSSEFVWTMGNHDTRYDRKLASEVSEFEDIPGTRLSDHFPSWTFSYSLMLNEDLEEPVIIKHAFKGGLHAVYNNTLHSGISIVTGHLHAQLCRPFTDYRGTRYGVDTGCLADTNGAQFSYVLDGPVNWRSGFGVLTFDSKGRMLPPELCEVQKYKDVKRAVFQGKTVLEESA